jgi:hypothetical protein
MHAAAAEPIGHLQRPVCAHVDGVRRRCFAHAAA